MINNQISNDIRKRFFISQYRLLCRLVWRENVNPHFDLTLRTTRRRIPCRSQKKKQKKKTKKNESMKIRIAREFSIVNRKCKRDFSFFRTRVHEIRVASAPSLATVKQIFTDTIQNYILHKFTYRNTNFYTNTQRVSN